jgi:SsrA-binding protein
MKVKNNNNNKLILKNKKAYFNYEIIETELAGIKLLGTEVKSIRLAKISFSDSYCLFIDNELWLRNFHISEYEHKGYTTHDPKRDKKLLLTKHQLKRFQKQIENKGITIVPLSIETNPFGIIKINIGLVKGKKSYDKKISIKEKDIDMETKKTLTTW